MKHLSLSGWLLALMCCAASGAGLVSNALAMENHADVLRDQYGRFLGGGSVYVYSAGSTVLATIYSDNGTTPKGNPLSTDILTGRYNFYAANGAYDLVFSHPDATFDANHTKRITLFDPTEVGGGGGGGGGGGTVTYCYKRISATSYTVLSTDSSCLLEFDSPDPVAVTIPQAGSVGFSTTFRTTLLNTGADLVTVTPDTSLIQGLSTLDIGPGQSTDIASDGTNYVYTPGLTANAGWPLSSTVKSLTWATSEANAQGIGGPVRQFKFYDDPTDGLVIKPSPLADTVIRVWPGQEFFLHDQQNDCDILRVNPGAVTPFSAWEYGCTATLPSKTIRVALSPRGAVTMTEESIVSNQPKSWYATLTDSNTDAVDFSFSVSKSMGFITSATVRLYGVSKNATPSGNISLDCAMKSFRPGTDTFTAHSTTSEQAVTLTPATQNRPVSATSSTTTINGTVADGALIYGSCEVNATNTTSTQMTDFRLFGFADVTIKGLVSLSD